MGLHPKKALTSVDIAKEYAHRIWEERDLTAIDILLTEDVVIHSSFDYYQGRAKMTDVVSAYYTAFPDLKVVNDFGMVQTKVTFMRKTGLKVGRVLIVLCYPFLALFEPCHDFTISEEDKTLIHWSASGTHLGVFKDVQPKGKKIPIQVLPSTALPIRKSSSTGSISTFIT